MESHPPLHSAGEPAVEAGQQKNAILKAAPAKRAKLLAVLLPVFGRKRGEITDWETLIGGS